MNLQRVLTVEQIKRTENACFDAGLPQAALMEQAIQGLARHIIRTYPMAQFPNVVVLAGKGGNGADGYGVARALALAGYKTHAINVENIDPAKKGNEKSSEVSELNAAQQDFARHCKVTIIPSRADLHQLVFVCAQADIIIDAIYGTGFTGNMPEQVAGFFNLLKKEIRSGIKAAAAPASSTKQMGKPVILAIDGPSGLNLNGIQDPASLESLQPRETLTLGSLKPALVDDSFGQAVGIVRCIPLAIPLPSEWESPILLSEYDTQSELRQELQLALATHSVYAHKYERGRTIVSAGSEKYPGAGILALSGALAAFPGYVQAVQTGQTEASAASEKFPSVVPINESDLASQLQIASSMARPVACLFGPGQTDFSKLTIEFIQTWQGAIVLDAGTLKNSEILRLFPYPHSAALSAPRIMTPHRAEFEALWNHFSGFTSNSARASDLNLLDRTRLAATSLNAIIVLKGANTIIATPNGESFVHAGPNPLLATAGTGDVLAGYLTGLLARGVTAVTAAKAAVVIHAQAAQELLTSSNDDGMNNAHYASQLCFASMLAQKMQHLTLRIQYVSSSSL
jgi:NAD(P)H-hydrate epimerase